MNMAVDGSNPFNTGWAARLLGLPRTHPHQAVFKDGDVAAFRDGWDMCDETLRAGSDPVVDALHKMIRLGQVLTYWVDDDNNELDESGRRVV